MAFIEIWIPPDSLGEGRQGLEDDLDDALRDAGLGEVTGGGGGEKGSNIDIEVPDVEAAISTIRRVLRQASVHPGTIIRQREPIMTVWALDG